MIKAASFIGAAGELGFRLYTGVPCSYLKPFINYAIDADGLRYIGAANEGDAVAIGAGAELGGMRSVVMFQNSGLGNAVNPLSSLTHTFRIPVLLIPTLRGDPGGAPDEPQHELMGRITTRMLELLEIPWEFFPCEEEQVVPALRRAMQHMETHHTPYALVMKKGSVEEWKLQTRPGTVESRHPASTGEDGEAVAKRGDFLRTVQLSAGPQDVLLATTGFTGRELHAADDHANQLYMVGSMGCISSLGLGLAVAQPRRRVFVLDGDGAALMRLGALSTVGSVHSSNLVHILFDNGVHESTGGQSTSSATTSFCEVAAACGYRRVGWAQTPEDLGAILAESHKGPLFVHVRVVPGSDADRPRPSIQPPEQVQRFRNFLGQIA